MTDYYDYRKQLDSILRVGMRIRNKLTGEVFVLTERYVDTDDIPGHRDGPGWYCYSESTNDNTYIDWCVYQNYELLPMGKVLYKD